MNEADDVASDEDEISRASLRRPAASVAIGNMSAAAAKLRTTPEMRNAAVHRDRESDAFGARDPRDANQRRRHRPATPEFQRARHAERRGDGDDDVPLDRVPRFVPGAPQR